MTRVEVTGADTLRRTLRRAGDDLTHLGQAHRDVAGIVNDRARAPRRTGRLAASQRTEHGESESAVTATAPYAGVIHGGWPARNIAPQPWIATAAQATEPLWLSRFEQALDRILAQIKGA